MWSSSPAVSSRQQLSITIFGSDKLTPKERLVWIRFPANKTATVLKLLSTVKLPQCVNLVNRGEFGIGAVLHQPIALNLPHIILGGKIDPAVVGDIAALLETTLANSGLPLQIKMRVQIACVCFNLPLLLCGDSLADVPVLDMHVAPAICQQVTQQRLERGKLADPFALDKQVSAPASLPPVRQFVVWARISDKDHKSEKSHLRIARQILSMVNSPPADEIGPRFANVDKLELILEHASSWRHALAERRAYHFVQQVVADQTVVLCVNLNRVTRRLDDFNQLVDDLNAIGARLYTQTSLHHGGMLETLDHAREHLKHALKLSFEHAFYTDSALLLNRVINSSATRPEDVQASASALHAYTERCGIGKVVILSRTSNNGSQNSLRRRTAALELLAPPALEVKTLALDGKLTTHRAATADALRACGARDAMILCTSIDRLVRHPLQLHKLRKLAEDKNLVIVVTTWQAVNLPVLLAKVLDKGQGDQPYFPAVARNFIHSLKALAQQLGKPGDVKHLVYLEENQALFRMCVNKQSHAAWQHLRTDRHIDSPIFRERSAATPFY
ncbi:hypothetical protein Rhopal_004291-T1 [Rhodotorula paludigena]|uniref:Resolvase/invertase-type recombinase catalytic domain-containing protein n=1 Tax=Rhodotorula paludigena TaxID=86838 RepID=A0AAV5GPH2_9BASI|nr:hypothetical protein Rhopal_004291-T1 [Rhodotorula paludigena]